MIQIQTSVLRLPPIFDAFKIHLSSYSYAEDRLYRKFLLHSHNLQGKKSMGRDMHTFFLTKNRQL